MKNLFISVLFYLGSSLAALAQCAPDQLDIKGDFGMARFNVEIADTPQSRAVGLMNRENMARSAGMLFVFERAQPVAFWMRNTLIPLDMLFIAADGTVKRIHENAVPLDETSIPGGNGIQYVLEINGGLSRAMGISVGSVVRNPMMDQEKAEWAC